MTISERNRRALILWAVAVIAILIVRWFLTGDDRGQSTAAAAPVDSIPRAEQRLERLRRMAATVDSKTAVFKQVTAELGQREKGVLVAETAPQAQAQLLQIIRKLGKANQIDVRGGEFGPVRPLGTEYGEVTVAVSFECQIEKLVNFLAELTAQPEILATTEIRITAANAKEKTVAVRIGLSGVVPRTLVPARKGLAQF